MMTETSAPPDSAAETVKTMAETCTCFAIRRAARQVTALYDEYLSGAGITVGQYSILGRLSRLGPLTINELAQVLGMDRTTMSRTIRPLERDGLVAVSATEADRRRRALTVTVDGRARLRLGASRWREAQARIESVFGADRARELRTMLAALAACDLAPSAEHGSSAHAV